MSVFAQNILGFCAKNAKGELLALEHTSKGYMFGVSPVFYTVYKHKKDLENDIRNFNRRRYKCRILPIFGVAQ